MVEVDPLDAPALRYLWWEDDNMTKVIVIQATVHIFGAASSPAVANFTLRHLANEIKNDYPPEVVEAIYKSMYVDDFMHSFDDPAEGRRLKMNMCEAFEKGGFSLLKWKTSCPEIQFDDSTSPSVAPQVVDAAGGGRTAQPTTTSMGPDPAKKELRPMPPSQEEKVTRKRLLEEEGRASIYS